jgi:ABC-2 type transport system permease protein
VARFRALLRQELLAAIPGGYPRLAAPITRTTEWTAEGRPNNIGTFLIPFVYGLLFYGATFMSSSYLMQSLVEEKETRMMEILATSVRPGELMTGKILGLGLLGLVQFAIWIVAGLGVLTVGREYVPFLAEMTIPWEVIGLLIALFVPSYLLFAASLSAIGAGVSAIQEGQQISGIFSMMAVIPYWFIGLIGSEPDSPVVLALSFFPYTAPVTLLLRQAAAAVPVWQVAVTLTSVSLGAAAAMWLAGRVMRYGMLRYGKRLGLGELAQAVRGN